MSEYETATPRSPRGAAGIGLLAAGLVAVSAGAATGVVLSHDSGARTVTVAEQASAVRVLDRTRTPPVPDVLVPPPGNVATATFSAKGVQVYRCTRSESTPPGNPTLGWTFVEPVATLTGRTEKRHKHVSAVHFRGPSWQSDQDGSLIEGKGAANSPVPGSIPQLLVQAVRTQGTGVFGRVSYVQRLATTGGAAPTGTCTEGTVTGVPYRAVYRFFEPA